MSTALPAQHLATLRNQPFHLASYQILSSLLIPTFVLADILIPINRTMTLIKRTGWENNTRYYLSAALDIRASSILKVDRCVDPEKINETAANVANVANEETNYVSVPLHLIPCHRLQLQREPYNFEWFLRMLALLIFASQATLVQVFWFRRALQGARTFLDDYIAVAALGGLLIAIQSMVIMLLNTAWHVPKEYVTRFEKHCSEPSLFDLFLNLAWRTDLVDLRVSLVLALVLQSRDFLWTKSEYSTDVLLGATCNKRSKSVLGGGLRALVPTPNGLE